MAIPSPKKDEIQIKIIAAGVNRPDILQRQGLYPPPPGAPKTPGLEVAGIVTECGQNTKRFKIGDKVCALISGGGYAQYCCAPEKTTLPIPKNLSFHEAAALPETVFTVCNNIFIRNKLKKTENILIHGGTSGIGTIAIMLAKNFGANVFATAGSDEKCQICIKLGAQKAINYKKNDFVDIIKNETNGKGVNMILDMVGGDYIQKNIKIAATDAKIISIAFLKGAKNHIDLLPVMIKRLTITGSTLRPRSIKEKYKIAQYVEKNIWPLIEKNKVKTNHTQKISTGKCTKCT